MNALTAPGTARTFWFAGRRSTRMNAEKLELVRGSGNVFRDLGHENADLEQLKALLVAEIIKGWIVTS